MRWLTFTTCGGQVWRAVLAASAGRRDQADDVTAETFSQYLQQHPEEVRDPLAYLFRIAYRLLAKERAREKRQVELLDRDEVAASQSVLSPTLTKALLGVSIEQRFAVFLHYFCDYPVSDVARLTGSSVPAVKVRLHRARKQLREALPEREANDV